MSFRIPDSACTPKGHQPITDADTPNPLTQEKSSLDRFFHIENPVRWLPEVYAADHGGDTRGFVDGLRIMSVWNRFPLKSSAHALLQYCESDYGRKQLALLASVFAFQVVSDHLAINAGSCSADRLKDNMSESTGSRRANRDCDRQDTRAHASPASTEDSDQTAQTSNPTLYVPKTASPVLLQDLDDGTESLTNITDPTPSLDSYLPGQDSEGSTFILNTGKQSELDELSPTTAWITNTSNKNGKRQPLIEVLKPSQDDVLGSSIASRQSCPPYAEQDIPSIKQSGTILGKRGRDLEVDERYRRQSTSEEGKHAIEGPNTKKSASCLDNPLLDNTRSDNSDMEDEENEDAATIALEQSHHPLNTVFDYEAFNFGCIIGSYDISAPFNTYYEDSIAIPFDHVNFEDFLATAGILFLSKEPTNLQQQHFGKHFEKLREVMVQMVHPHRDDEIATSDEEDDTVAFCQAARNVYRKAERKSGSEYARKQLKKRIGEEEDSPLKELYEHAVKLPKECVPISEADQTSSFILGMLRPIFDRPDFSRLAQNLSNTSRNPDFLVWFKECLDIGVAEVSLTASALKDTGDLCRTALWSKRALDEIVTKFEDMEQLQLIFFQVVEQTCIFYTMKRADTVCIAVEIARLKIAYTISDILTGFEDHALDWLLVCRTFDSLVTTLKSAKERTLANPPPPVFAGLTTPRSRHMNKDTRRRS
ncbi:hypothetical protein BGZ58_001004 [Dissophora ornata]|nr:hypothetical protein BGZ58_001004 [Dissophora ornata]